MKSAPIIGGAHHGDWIESDLPVVVLICPKDFNETVAVWEKGIEESCVETRSYALMRIGSRHVWKPCEATDEQTVDRLLGMIRKTVVHHV